MRSPLARISPDDGGCGFAHDPSIPVGSEPVAWLPELSPGTLLLDAAPSGFAPLTLDPSQLGTIVADRTDDEGREIVIGDGSGELHIRLSNEAAIRSPMVLMPISGASIDLRLDVASRFIRRLRGQTISLLPQALRLTTLRKRRLVQLLHAFDIHEEGGGPREIAEQILRSDQAQLPSVEWKDSHTRRAANRLIHDSVALVERDYLKLLRGC